MLTFDFESEGIVGNPIYAPPVPVGVSIKYDDQKSKYYAWGHPTKNNCTREQGYDRQLPAGAELLRQAFGRIVTAVEAAVRIGRDEGQRVGARPRDNLADELRSEPRELPQAALLPRGDEQACRVVVGHCGPRARESDAPSRALAAALDRPGGRGAAPLATRLAQPA